MNRQAAIDHIVQTMADLSLAFEAEGFRREADPDEVRQFLQARFTEDMTALTTVFSAEEIAVSVNRVVVST